MSGGNNMNVDDRIALFSELLACQGEYYLWSYDPEGNLLSTNCSYLYLDSILRRADCFSGLLEYAQTESTPMIISASIGLLWGAVMEREDEKILRIHVIGPLFNQMPSRKEMEAVLRGISPAVRRWSPKLIRRLESLPVVTFSNLCHRILMLHYCVNGEHIPISDITLNTSIIEVLNKTPDSEEEEAELHELPDRNRVYRAEQALLTMVRQGDLQYKESLTGIASVFNGKQKLSHKPLQHAKLSQVVIIALASRAAIEGGVSPEVIYPRTDAYILDVDNATNAPEVTEVGMAMLEDFVQLVHAQKLKEAYSKPIRSCCDYIDAHLEDRLSIQDLARRIGYTDYYLSRKFKKETGMSIGDYIKEARIRRAQMLLTTTDMSIQDISEKLGFGARSFFAEVFKQVTGVPPAQWRNENRIV